MWKNILIAFPACGRVEMTTDQMKKGGTFMLQLYTVQTKAGFKASLVLERIQVFKGFLNDSVSTSVPGMLKEKQINKICDLETFY